MESLQTIPSAHLTPPGGYARGAAAEDTAFAGRPGATPAWVLSPPDAAHLPALSPLLQTPISQPNRSGSTGDPGPGDLQFLTPPALPFYRPLLGEERPADFPSLPDPPLAALSIGAAGCMAATAAAVAADVVAHAGATSPASGAASYAATDAAATVAPTYPAHGTATTFAIHLHAAESPSAGQAFPNCAAVDHCTFDGGRCTTPCGLDCAAGRSSIGTCLPADGLASTATSAGCVASRATHFRGGGCAFGPAAAAKATLCAVTLSRLGGHWCNPSAERYAACRRTFFTEGGRSRISTLHYNGAISRASTFLIDLFGIEAAGLFAAGCTLG